MFSKAEKRKMWSKERYITIFIFVSNKILKLVFYFMQKRP